MKTTAPTAEATDTTTNDTETLAENINKALAKLQADRFARNELDVEITQNVKELGKLQTATEKSGTKVKTSLKKAQDAAANVEADERVLEQKTADFALEQAKATNLSGLRAQEQANVETTQNDLAEFRRRASALKQEIDGQRKELQTKDTRLEEDQAKLNELQKRLKKSGL